MGISHNTNLECVHQINTMHPISRHHLGRERTSRRHISLNNLGWVLHKVRHHFIINPVPIMGRGITRHSPLAQRRHLEKTLQW
jgi:hypothetical protein